MHSESTDRRTSASSERCWAFAFASASCSPQSCVRDAAADHKSARKRHRYPYHAKRGVHVYRSRPYGLVCNTQGATVGIEEDIER
eukprot:717869-Prymnesium_polylepis.1